MMDRRSLITGLISLIAAPAIVRAGSLMPVKIMNPAIDGVFEWGPVKLFWQVEYWVLDVDTKTWVRQVREVDISSIYGDANV